MDYRMVMKEKVYFCWPFIVDYSKRSSGSHMLLGQKKEHIINSSSFSLSFLSILHIQHTRYYEYMELSPAATYFSPCPSSFLLLTISLFYIFNNFLSIGRKKVEEIKFSLFYFIEGLIKLFSVCQVLVYLLNNDLHWMLLRFLM